jgi:4-amino-4-deoxy-L-arabinose transferase-like glycosyltransferase
MQQSAEYIFEIFSHLFFLSSILLSASGTGYILLRKQPFYSFLEKIIFSIVIGLGLWASFLFFLGLIGLLYKTLILILTLLCATAVIIFILRSASLRIFRKNYIIAIASAFFFGLLLSVTLYPPTQWDATMYHLVLARQYLIDHRITPNTGLHFPILPILSEMLFSWALALKGHLLAQMIECSFLILTAAGLYSYCFRLGQPAVGLAAAAFWFANPIALWLGRSAFVEIGVITFLFFGVYALHLFWQHHQIHWWYIGMALLSFASAAKMLALPMLLLGAAIALCVFMKSNVTVKTIFTGYMIALIIVIPWYALIGYFTGNPFWPFFYQHSNGIWASSPNIPYFFKYILSVGVQKTIPNFFLIPYYLCFHSGLFQPGSSHYFFFPLIAWMLAVIVSFFHSRVRWWTCWAFCYHVLWFFSTQQLRFWFVCFPILIIASFDAANWILEKLIQTNTVRRSIWISFACVGFVLSAYLTVSLFMQFGAPSVTITRQHQFLMKHVDGYKAVQYINERSNEKDVVYIIDGSWLAYYFKPKVIDMFSLVEGSFKPVAHWPEDKVWLEYLRSKNVGWIFVNYVSPQIGLNLSHGSPPPYWPDYQLVYSDDQSWIFRYSH